MNLDLKNILPIAAIGAGILFLTRQAGATTGPATLAVGQMYQFSPSVAKAIRLPETPSNIWIVTRLSDTMASLYSEDIARSQQVTKVSLANAKKTFLGVKAGVVEQSTPVASQQVAEFPG